jgi:hypothetical protein
LPHTPKEKANPSGREGTAGRVRLDMSKLPYKPKTLLERLRYWYQNSLLRLLLWEGNGSLQRIRWTRQRRVVLPPVGKGLVPQNHLWFWHSPMPAAYRPDYILYIRQLEARHPFLSMFDMHLVSRAWRAGLEYGIRIGKLQSQDQKANDTSASGKDTSL